MCEKKTVHWSCLLGILTLSLACNFLSGQPSSGVTETPDLIAGPTNSTVLVKVTLVTGDDGTEDNPIFELLDSSRNILFSTTLDNPGDLQPGQTDMFEFPVPQPFCILTVWQMTKPSTSGEDDSWLVTSISIEIDGTNVYLDGSFSSLGIITVDSQRGGDWSGIPGYQQQCGP